MDDAKTAVYSRHMGFKKTGFRLHPYGFSQANSLRDFVIGTNGCRHESCNPRKNRAILPFDKLWYGAPNVASNAVGYAKFYSRSCDIVVRIFDASDDLVETRQQSWGFKEP